MLIIFSFSPAFEVGRNKEKFKLYEQISLKFMKLKEKYGDFLFSLSKNQIKQYEIKQNCGAGYKTVTLSPNGILRACPMFYEILEIGDLNKISFKDLFSYGSSNQFAQMKAPDYNNCSNCQNLNYCVGCISRGLVRGNQSKDCSWLKKFNFKAKLENAKIRCVNNMC